MKVPNGIVRARLYDLGATQKRHTRAYTLARKLLKYCYKNEWLGDVEAQRGYLEPLDSLGCS